MYEDVVQVEATHIAYALEELLYVLRQLLFFLADVEIKFQLLVAGGRRFLVFHVEVDRHLQRVSPVFLEVIQRLFLRLG
jgi:hypothetical protein